jgi:peroxiredoxin
MLVYEVVDQGFRLLAEQVYLVALADQGAAEVLDVDVAPGAREHVAVGHQQLHAARIAERSRLRFGPAGSLGCNIGGDTTRFRSDEEDAMARTKVAPVPEVGDEAPEFNLPSAQGGQLRLSMRTVRGPVVVVFYRGPEDEEEVEYFKALAGKEDEINLAAGSVVGIGVAGPDEARALVRESGINSYVLYDYVKAASRDWGLLEKDKKRGDYSRPAVFVVGPDHKIAHAWTEGRPDPAELLAKVSEITGLPKPAEEEEKPGKDEAAEGGEKPKKMSAEERERIKAERRAAREAGKSLKSGDSGAGEKPAPKKLTAEERERIKAERRAAREAKAAEEAKAGDAGEKKPAEG